MRMTTTMTMALTRKTGGHHSSGSDTRSTGTRSISFWSTARGTGLHHATGCPGEYPGSGLTRLSGMWLRADTNPGSSGSGENPGVHPAHGPRGFRGHGGPVEFPILRSRWSRVCTGSGAARRSGGPCRPTVGHAPAGLWQFVDPESRKRRLASVVYSVSIREIEGKAAARAGRRVFAVYAIRIQIAACLFVHLVAVVAGRPG